MTSFGSNTELTCTQQQYETFKEIFDKIVEKNITYNIVITGTIAAGKSLRCDLMKDLMRSVDKEHHYDYSSECSDDEPCKNSGVGGHVNNKPSDNTVSDNCLDNSCSNTAADTISNMVSDNKPRTCIYPEYITHSDIGDLMLKRFHDGMITNITFQHYIVDEWHNIFSRRPLGNVNLFERCPEDGVKIFCPNMEPFNKEAMRCRLEELAIKFNIPHFGEGAFNFTRIHSHNAIVNISEMLDVIKNDVEKMAPGTVRHRIFGLIISAEESYQRLKKRSRKAEDALDFKVMKSYVESYEELYAELQKKACVEL
jgi:hypothetical protein